MTNENDTQERTDKGTIFHCRLSDTQKSFALRNSQRFHSPKFAVLDDRLNQADIVRLKSLCKVPIRSGVAPQYDEEGEGVYLSQIEMRTGEIDLLEAKHLDDGFVAARVPAYDVRKSDIFITTAAEGTIGKVALYRHDTPAVFSNFVARIRLSELHNPLFVTYSLKSSLFQLQVEREKAGMGNLTNIYPYQLAELRLPSVLLAEQNRVAAKIGEVESRINARLVGLRKPIDVINGILCDAFHYPLAEHKARERETRFNRRLSDFGHALTLRGSSRFHHPDGALLDAFFARTPHEPLKNFIAVPIRLGATLTQGDLDENGETYCVHPSAIRREEGIDPQNCLRVGLDFYNAGQRRFGLRDGDIVMARSGEGTIGKAALFEAQAEEAFLFSDFTMRLRLGDSLSSRFAAYYFRSVMFQQQVNREKRGMGNMTNIFPPQVGAMLVPIASREGQDELARTITTALSTLQDDRDAIEAGRAEINALVEAALR